MVSGQWLGTVANPGSSEKRSKRLTNFRFALKMTWCAEQNMYDAVIRSFWCWILIATCGRNGSLLRKLWHIAEDLPQRPQLLALQLWWSRRPGVWVSSQWAKGHMLKTPAPGTLGQSFVVHLEEWAINCRCYCFILCSCFFSIPFLFFSICPVIWLWANLGNHDSEDWGSRFPPVSVCKTQLHRTWPVGCAGEEVTIGTPLEHCWQQTHPTFEHRLNIFEHCQHLQFWDGKIILLTWFTWF